MLCRVLEGSGFIKNNCKGQLEFLFSQIPVKMDVDSG